MADRILVVDDEPEALKLFGYALHRQGYEVVVAQNGAQALELIAKQKPDLIILDVMMPGMNGFDVCRSVRTNRETRALPIIMLTAKSEVEDKLTGFEVGADDYISKPVTLAELFARVKALLLRARLSGSSTSHTVDTTVIAFLGAKGGVGTTTLAVNTGVALLKQKKTVLLAELRLWGGAAAVMLRLNAPTTIASLMALDVAALDEKAVRAALVSHFSGLGLLAAPAVADRVHEPQTMTLEKVQQLLRGLKGRTDYLLLDLGVGLTAEVVEAFHECKHTFLVSEQCPISLSTTRATLAGISALGLAGNRINIIINNRSRTSIAMTRIEVENALGQRFITLVSPSPEMTFQAIREGSAVVLMQPDSTFSQAIGEVVQAVL